MKTEDAEVLMLALALLYRRSIFVKKLEQLHEKTIQIEDEEALFLIELILCGSFDEEILKSIFLLPTHLIEEIKAEYLN